MIKSFFASPRWAPWAYGVGAAIVAIIWMQVDLSVQINTWYRPEAVERALETYARVRDSFTVL